MRCDPVIQTVGPHKEGFVFLRCFTRELERMWRWVQTHALTEAGNLSPSYSCLNFYALCQYWVVQSSQRIPCFELSAISMPSLAAADRSYNNVVLESAAHQSGSYAVGCHCN